MSDTALLLAALWTAISRCKPLRAYSTEPTLDTRGSAAENGLTETAPEAFHK
jgi:hypothetical protein